jgi:hypothetical protein
MPNEPWTYTTITSLSDSQTLSLQSAYQQSSPTPFFLIKELSGKTRVTHLSEFQSFFQDTLPEDVSLLIWIDE